MRTTMNLHEELFAGARELTGIRERNTLALMGLESLIARESAIRLAGSGGTMTGLKDVPRRRSKAS